MIEKLDLEKTTFAYLSDILQNVKLNENDLDIIRDVFEIYWIHDQIFKNYPNKIVAHSLIKILSHLKLTETDLSSFSIVDLQN